jgi:hypothetical protein
VGEGRDEIGECLVKREDVGTARNREIGAQSVQDRMCQLVRDHIVRQTREYEATRERTVGRKRPRRFDIPETQDPLHLVVIGVSLAESMRLQIEQMRVAFTLETPADLASQRALEHRIDIAAYRVHHLLVEARIRRSGVLAAFDQEGRVIEIYPPVLEVQLAIFVVHREPRADRPRLQALVRR